MINSNENKNIVDFTKIILSRKWWIICFVFAVCAIVFALSYSNKKTFIVEHRVSYGQGAATVANGTISDGLLFTEVQVLRNLFEEKGMELSTLVDVNPSSERTYSSFIINKKNHDSDISENFYINGFDDEIIPSFYQFFKKQTYSNLIKKINADRLRIDYLYEEAKAISLQFDGIKNISNEGISANVVSLNLFENELLLPYKGNINAIKKILHQRLNVLSELSKKLKNGAQIDEVKKENLGIFNQYIKYKDLVLEQRMQQIWLIKSEKKVVKAAWKKRVLLSAVCAVFISIVMIFIFEAIKKEYKYSD